MNRLGDYVTKIKGEIPDKMKKVFRPVIISELVVNKISPESSLEESVMDSSEKWDGTNVNGYSFMGIVEGGPPFSTEEIRGNYTNKEQ